MTENKNKNRIVKTKDFKMDRADNQRLHIYFLRESKPNFWQENYVVSSYSENEKFDSVSKKLSELLNLPTDGTLSLTSVPLIHSLNIT